MIHDATVEVTCDGKNCRQSVQVEPEYVYSDYSGRNGRYDTDDSSIEDLLEDRHKWIVDDGKHYCDESCKP